jgi:tetrahydromethanopterin S-methyltransferase subunit E
MKNFIGLFITTFVVYCIVYYIGCYLYPPFKMETSSMIYFVFGVAIGNAGINSLREYFK